MTPDEYKALRPNGRDKMPAPTDERTANLALRRHLLDEIGRLAFRWPRSKPRPVFVGPDFAVANGTQHLVSAAHDTLAEQGFDVMHNAVAVYLFNADSETATRAGNALTDAGFCGGICW